ncbi:hypothetical protein ACTHOQ_18445 [Solibacillus silvestris]|uniref:hypothetical protein n=1 Tax=Solibacillus TaxID=648800 RepID=UPI0030FB9AA0
MVDNTSVILAILIAERLDAQYETDECKAIFKSIEELLQNQTNDNEQSIESVRAIQNYIHQLNEMTYLNAFKDAYQLFSQLGRTN